MQHRAPYQVQAIVIAPIRNIVVLGSRRTRPGIYKLRESVTFCERIPASAKLKRGERDILRVPRG